jgi:hypothetical protein
MSDNWAQPSRGVAVIETQTSQNRVARFFLVQTYQKRKNLPNDRKIFQMVINYNKKFTQIGIFGLKINHLATLITKPKNLG